MSRDTLTRRVLLVEDDGVQLEALTSAIEGGGSSVISCRTFEDARAYLLKNAVDVLVTDIRLGPFNGLQLAMIARQEHDGIRIVVVSGYDDPVLRTEAARIGAKYLLKPIDVQQLLGSLEEQR